MGIRKEEDKKRRRQKKKLKKKKKIKKEEDKKRRRQQEEDMTALGTQGVALASPRSPPSHVFCHGIHAVSDASVFQPSLTDSMQIMFSLAQSLQHSPKTKLWVLCTQLGKRDRGQSSGCPHAPWTSHGQQDHASFFRWSSITA